MAINLLLEFAVPIGALVLGARTGGVGLGLWGAVGLLVLVVGFGIPPGTVPGEVLIIVLTVIMADKLGFIAGMELNPQKARILLMLGLAQTSGVRKLQQFFSGY